MVGDIANWRPAITTHEKANILVFGPAGAGKSALINSIFSLWYETYTSTASAMDSDDHVTLESAFYQEQQGFAFLDTVGLSDNNYLNSEFNNILNGALPVGFKINESKNMNSAIMKTIDTMKDREIHAVIFVIPQGWRGFVKSQPDKIKKFREFVQYAARLKLAPLVAVTRYDEVDLSERPNLKKEFKSITGIGERDIFLIDNSDREIKDFQCEKSVYQLLRKALDYSNQFLKQKTPQSFVQPQPTQKVPTSSFGSSQPPQHVQSSSTTKPLSLPLQQSQPPPQQPPPYSTLTSSSQGQLPPTVDFISVFDVTSQRSLGDVYETFNPANDTIDSARAHIEEQLGATNFEFVNAATQQIVNRHQETKAKLRLVFDFPNGVPRVLVRVTIS